MSDLSSYWSSSYANQAPVQKGSSASGNYDPGDYYAGFWIRFAALFIDGIIFLIIFAVIAFIFLTLLSGLFASSNLITSIASVSELLTLLGFYAYFIIFTGLFSATPGKKIAGLKVLKSDFTKLSWPRVILRELIGRPIASIFSVTFLAVAINSRKRGLHDLIADSVVVRNKPAGKYETPFFVCLFIGIMILPVFLVGFLAAFNPLGQMRKAPEIQNLHPITSESSGASYGHFPTVYPTIGMITPTIVQPTYFPTPAVGPTDSWSSFVNTADHYSIKYPPGYTYTSADVSNYPNASTSPDVQIAASDPNTSPWKIEIVSGATKQPNISLLDTVSEDIKNRSAFYRPEVSKLAILFTASIAGHNAVFYGNNNLDPNYLVMGAVIEKDATNIVSIMTSPDPKADRDSYTKFLYQIVSTFQFTE